MYKQIARRLPKMRRASLVLVLAVLVAACGGDGGGGGSAEGGGGGDRDFDRCSLMTAEEAEQWLGSPVDSVGPSDMPVNSEVTCSYQSTTNEKIVLLQVYDGEKYFAFAGSDVRGPDTIAGLGEDAHTDGDSLSFLKDDFTVSISRIQGTITVAELEEIARLIESRLP